MTEPTPPRGQPQPLTVLRDRRIQSAGIRRGDVVAYDWGFEHDGRHHVQRSFVLLDHGVQINQPVTFPAEQQGWWYCDLVTVTDHGHVLHVDDMWIDAIVGPPDHPYRILDLDDYAEAMTTGTLNPTDAADGLIRWQHFLDQRLNRRHDTTRRWPDFPPADVTALMTVELPQQWTLLPDRPNPPPPHTRAPKAFRNPPTEARQESARESAGPPAEHEQRSGDPGTGNLFTEVEPPKA
ncbi:hypothetical protein [Kitasatospora sp. NPDC059571]|uniref:hypothetical protein n=1 Tax=Kitasatospora sp. NPDC059571 TaxID=3346871 RepID=UPI003675B076